MRRRASTRTGSRRPRLGPSVGRLAADYQLSAFAGRSLTRGGGTPRSGPMAAGRARRAVQRPGTIEGGTVPAEAVRSSIRLVPRSTGPTSLVGHRVPRPQGGPPTCAATGKVALFSNEYPPHVYGGAGVHVEYLSRELAKLVPVEIRCFGDQDVDEPEPARPGLRPVARRRRTPTRGSRARSTPSLRDLAMAKDTLDADVVHCHTWYADMAGCPGQAPVGRAAGPDDAFARAAAAVEGRAAGQRLPPLVLDGADGDPRRRRDHRRVAGDEGRRAPLLPGRPGPAPRHPQRHRPRPVPARSRHRLPGAVRHRPRPPVRAVRRPDHAPEGDHPPGQRDPATSTARSRWCCAPAPPTRPRSGPR